MRHCVQRLVSALTGWTTSATAKSAIAMPAVTDGRSIVLRSSVFLPLDPADGRIGLRSGHECHDLEIEIAGRRPQAAHSLKCSGLPGGRHGHGKIDRSTRLDRRRQAGHISALATRGRHQHLHRFGGQVHHTQSSLRTRPGFHPSQIQTRGLSCQRFSPRGCDCHMD